MILPPKPKTLDEAWEIIQSQAQQIEVLTNQIKVLKEQVEMLKREIGYLKSDKSCKGPPSFVKANAFSKREKKKKKGPPFGHSHYGRRSLEDVDEEKEWHLEVCPDCGNAVSKTCDNIERIEIDVPPQAPVVTRHRIHRHWCRRCHKLVSPKVFSLLSKTPYGINLHLEVCHLKYGLGLTLEKIQFLLKERYDLSISTGLLSKMLTRVGKGFGSAYEWLREAINRESVLNVDETGWRVAGINHWLWSFSSREVVYYHIDRSRGQKVVTLVLGKSFVGVLVSDFYGGYHLIISTKQKCWVHILREIKKIEENNPEDKCVLAFTKTIRMYFHQALNLKSRWNELAPEVFKKEAQRIKNAILNLIDINSEHKDLRRLSKRLFKHRKELFIFLENKDVPHHNNDAERQIRPAVLMRKISYQNASELGATTQSILMSVIQTCRKRKIDFFDWAKQYLMTTTTGPPHNPFSLAVAKS